MTDRQHGLDRFFRFCFLFFAFLIVGIKCAYLFHLVPSLAAAAGTVGVLILTVLAFVWWQRLYDAVARGLRGLDRFSYTGMLMILAAVSLLTKLLAIAVFRIDSIHDGADIDTYVTSAYEIASTGTATAHASYITSFSHMFWFACFLAPVAALFGVSQTAFSVYLSIVLTVSSLLLFSVFAQQAGKKKAFLVFLIWQLLPGTVLLPQFITHEIALLFFESIAVWLYFRCLPQCRGAAARAAVYFLFTVFLFLGTLVNAAGLVLCIAFGIVFLARLLWDRNRAAVERFAAKSLILVLVLVIGSMAANGIQRRHCDVPAHYQPYDKVLWTLFVGASTEHNGEWSKQDVREYGAYDKEASPEEIRAFKENKVMERYRYLIANPAALGRLLLHKLTTVWGAFKYSIYYTGEFMTAPRLKAVYGQILDKLFLLAEYAASLIAAIVCLVQEVRRRKRASDFTLLLQLLLMGATAMLLITECWNKYTIALQPFFWMLCFSCCAVSGGKKVE